jgi:hypothetical protein
MASPSPGGDPQAAGVQESTPALQEKALSSPVRPESVAVFLELDIDVVANLGEVVLQHIAVKARQFEALKSQKMLDDVTYGKTLPKTCLSYFSSTYFDTLTLNDSLTLRKLVASNEQQDSHTSAATK